MSKYDRLGTYLRGQGKDYVPMTFAQIERVVGTKLPKSRNHQAWWSNSTSNNVMTQVWLDAGYRTEQVDVVAHKLVFSRTKVALSGMGAESRVFTQSEAKMKVERHPAIGWLKGTFTIEPGYDVTQPALDPDELAEWDANIERTAHMVDAGLKKKS